jgi:hypothetical protein
VLIKNYTKAISWYCGILGWPCKHTINLKNRTQKEKVSIHISNHLRALALLPWHLEYFFSYLILLVDDSRVKMHNAGRVNKQEERCLHIATSGVFD